MEPVTPTAAISVEPTLAEYRRMAAQIRMNILVNGVPRHRRVAVDQQLDALVDIERYLAIKEHLA